MTAHLVQFSTGITSAEVAKVVVDRHGPENVVLMTADTRIEDEDNWRFAFEVVEFIGRPEWQILADGRHPMQVGLDEGVVPNNRMAVCSRILKRELLNGYMDANYDPADSVVYLGFTRDRKELDRFAAHVAHMAPWKVEAPLIDSGHVFFKHDLFDVWRSRGIREPRLYDTGAPHANCGGGCVRGGQDEWRRLLYWNRDRYLWWEGWEERIRAKVGDFSILRDRTGKTLRPLSLQEFRLRLERDSTLFDPEDTGACGCDPFAPETAVTLTKAGTDA